MSEGTQDSERREGEDIARRLADLDGSLLRGAGGDRRLESGVPEEQRGSDLDFIQMAGMSSPGGLPSDPAVDDLNPEIPVNFFERGVSDVDGSLDPVSMADARIRDEDLVVGDDDDGSNGEVEGSSAVASLRALIADLAGAGESGGDSGNRDEVSDDGDQGGVHGLLEPDLLETDEGGPPALETPMEEDELVEGVAAGPEEAQVLDDGGDLAGDAEHLPSLTPDLGSREEIAPDDSTDLRSIIKALNSARPPGGARLRGTAGGSSGESDSSTPKEQAADRLAEAERLLRELEAQEREVDRPVDRAPDFRPYSGGGIEGDVFDAIPEAVIEDVPSKGDWQDDVDSRVLDELPPARRHRRGNSRAARAVGRIALWAAILGGIGLAGVVGYEFYGDYMATPLERYNRAERMLGNGQFERASAMFASIAEEYPRTPLASDAKFMAAHALQLTPEGPHRSAVDAYHASAVLFREFIIDYPDHPKRPRAETLLGTLQSKLGNHEEAIRILSRPGRRIEDPDAYLPSLRVLAQSHAALGEVEEAHSAYLRAASLESNFAPDEDYLNLAEMYKDFARSTADLEERLDYHELAVEYWTQALRMPGLPAARKRLVRGMMETERRLIETQRSADIETERDGPEIEWEPMPVDDAGAGSMVEAEEALADRHETGSAQP